MSSCCDDCVKTHSLAAQALEAQMGAAFAEHEAKLGQQQEALARQSQKGIATLQVRISSLYCHTAPPNAGLCSLDNGPPPAHPPLSSLIFLGI